MRTGGIFLLSSSRDIPRSVSVSPRNVLKKSDPRGMRAMSGDAVESVTLPGFEAFVPAVGVWRRWWWRRLMS